MTPADSSIQVEVLFFARARELAGSASVKLQLPLGSSVSGAAALLAAQYPQLDPVLKSCRIALNEELTTGSELVDDGAVLAVLPPVSGG
jgi:molybdopterin synthase catalytic subunit